MTLHGSFWVKVQISKALDIRQLKQNQVSKQGSKYEGVLYAETALWLPCESIYPVVCICVLLTRKVGLKLIKNSWDQIVLPNGGHLAPAGVNMDRFVPPHWAPMGTNGHQWAPIKLRCWELFITKIYFKTSQARSNSFKIRSKTPKCFFRVDQSLIVKYKGTDSGHCVLLKTRFYENYTHLAQSFLKLKSIVVLYELIKV